MQHLNLVAMGIIVVFIGIIIIFFGAFSQTSNQDSKSSAKVAVGGFVGPFLFGFGNDKQLSKILVIVSAAFFLFWIFFQIYFRK